jgi:hypothetical protein
MEWAGGRWVRQRHSVTVRGAPDLVRFEVKMLVDGRRQDHPAKGGSS